MKQLARTACYWLSSDSEIGDLYRKWPKSAGHQSEPSKAAIQPWMLPETVDRLHINRAFNFVNINGWFHGRLYHISLHSRKKVSVKEINDQALARRFGAFRFPLYGCNGLRCFFQVRGIPGIFQKEQNCSYNWSPVPSCYQRCCQKSDAYFQTSFTEFYQSSKRLFARFPEEFPAHTLIHRKSKNIKN